MWEETERSPVLAAPDSNNFTGLTGNSTTLNIGETDENFQGLSDEEANELCVKHRKFAFKIAVDYAGKGVDRHELKSAALEGLVLASRRFDPKLGFTFGTYAQHWVRGEIRALFKHGADLFSGRRRSLTIQHDDDYKSHQRDVADESSPSIALDLSALSEKDRYIVEARERGETLAEIGKTLGLTAERVRQREERARPKIKGIIASQCISDLTQRGKVIKFPEQRTRCFAEFRDREPPKHVYREPKPSREIERHRANASRLAELRGGEPLRSTRDIGPVIHAWGRP